MVIKTIYELMKKPKIYDKGTALMWSDPYIQKTLLHTHLNPSNDVASRKKSNIDYTLKWLNDDILKRNSLIIDLGCGPGLYASRLAELGHRVMGVDLNATSLDYAKGNAFDKGLTIDYVRSNYLEFNFPKNVDAVMIIFCDFGVLDEHEQSSFLNKIKQSLKPGGLLIFDAYTPNFIETLDLSRKTEVEMSGFWRDHPYIAISEGFIFPKNSAFLEQHIIIDDHIECYRFYNHAWSEDQVISKMKALGFREITVHRDISDDDKVCFYVAKS